MQGKRFAWLLVDHHDDGRVGLCVKAPPGEQETLVGQGVCYFVPASLGSKGWVGIDVALGVSADWDRVVAELNDARPPSAPFRGLGR